MQFFTLSNRRFLQQNGHSTVYLFWIQAKNIEQKTIRLLKCCVVRFFAFMVLFYLNFRENTNRIMVESVKYPDSLLLKLFSHNFFLFFHLNTVQNWIAKYILMLLLIFNFCIYRYGPHFDDVHVAEKVGNVSAQIGSIAFLDCRIRLLQDKTVNQICTHS